MKWIAALLILALSAGCSLKTLRQDWIGYSINDVRTSKHKQVQSFDMSSADCVAKIKETLKTMEAIVRENKKKQYIVADNFQTAFRSAIDTTRVGILVTSLSSDKCQVEVASENIALAEFVSKEIVNALNPKKESAVTK
jgi:hypothetical protein